VKALRLVLALLLPPALCLADGRPVRFIPFHQAAVMDTHWKLLLDRNRAITIPHILRMCREVGIVANFERVDVCGHEEVEPAVVRLYEATGDARWWKLAKFFVDTRGTEAGGRRKRGEFSRDHAPLFDQTEAVGQAPRATYFYSSAADIGRITGDERYYTALRRLWEDVVTRKLYLHGGIGSRHENEGFGAACELPNLTACAEVCAAVSFVMWSTRMFRLEADARYFDVIERTLYNNRAAGPPTLTVNGQPVELRNVLTSGFARLARDWRSGDMVELELPMPVRRVVARPEVKDCLGKVALQRGPSRSVRGTPSQDQGSAFCNLARSQRGDASFFVFFSFFRLTERTDK